MPKSPRKVTKGRSAEKSSASKRVIAKQQPQTISFGRTGYIDYGVDPTKGRKPKRK